MGRITIFAINGCPFCIKSKKALTERGIPYLEINLSQYPDKRSDMLSLSDSLTVPQIFFNEKYIGGSENFFEVLDEWDKDVEKSPRERYLMEVEEHPDPADPRLQPSTMEPVKEPVAPPRGEDDKIIYTFPNSEIASSVLDMTERLVRGVPLSDLVFRGKTYKNSVTGRVFTDWLMKEFDLTDEKDAMNFGRYLQDRKILDHVASDHKFSASKDLFFRLQPHMTPDVLNTYRVWTDRVDPNANAMVNRTGKIINGIFSRTTIEDGTIDAIKAAQDPSYPMFEESMCELQGVDMSGMDNNAKTSFVINVYNLLIKYAQVKVGVPKNNIQRSKFFTGVKVNIGGETYSFHQLENGILRANATPPYALRKTFGENDERLKLIVEKVDHRIHCALNCGAKSCPPVKKFSAKDLQEELRIVAQAFCELDENVLIDEAKSTVHLSMIFKWYLKDFCSSVDELPKVVVQHLRKEKKATLQMLIDSVIPLKVKFLEYDWSSNVSINKDVGKYDFKGDEYSVKSLFAK